MSLGYREMKIKDKKCSTLVICVREFEIQN